MNIHQRPHYMCFVKDAVESKNKAIRSDFLAESFRFSFPGEWQVCNSMGIWEIKLKVVSTSTINFKYIWPIAKYR